MSVEPKHKLCPLCLRECQQVANEHMHAAGAVYDVRYEVPRIV